MRLSRNFVLSELTRSQTASRLGIDNTPSVEDIQRLRLLCEHVLQPVRDHFRRAVLVTSGFRCQELNSRIGGSESSRHTVGEAADFSVVGVPNLEVCRWIRDELNFDQLIAEFIDPAVDGSGWVHVSYGADSNRKQVLTVTHNGVSLGLPTQ